MTFADHIPGAVWFGTVLLALAGLLVAFARGDEQLKHALRQAERDRLKDLENRNSEDKK